MKKIIRREQGTNRVEVEITLENGRLSICGGHWTKKGRHWRECCFGQNVDEIKRFFPELQPYMKWHLNDMHAECEHQEARGETWATHPGAKCPDCGYKLGSAWTKRELPADVVAFLEAFNDR